MSVISKQATPESSTKETPYNIIIDHVDVAEAEIDTKDRFHTYSVWMKTLLRYLFLNTPALYHNGKIVHVTLLRHSKQSSCSTFGVRTQLATSMIGTKSPTLTLCLKTHLTESCGHTI
jgi:hypothetical protein